MAKGNLGRMGETYFNNLCSTVNLTCNSSIEDNTGWDFLVEFPHEFDNLLFADKAPPPKEFKAQIKATNDLKKKLSIKMSNLMRLCTTSLPCFLIFMEFNHKPQPENIYLVHIGKKIMFDTLRRARTNSISNARKNFNNASLTVAYGDEHKLHALTGDALIDAVNKYIPDGMDTYVKNKKMLLDNLGYEEGRGQLKFNTNISDWDKDIVSASLGWIEKIKVSDVLGFDTRFNILTPVDGLSSNEAEISFQIPKGTLEGTVCFTNLKTKKKIRQDCDIYISQVASVAPKGMRKFRVKGASFDMLIGFDGGKCQYKFIDDNVSASPYVIRDSLLLMRWFTFQEDEVEISLKGKSADKNLKFTTNIDSATHQDNEFRTLLDKLDIAAVTVIEISSILNLEQQLKTSIKEIRNNIDKLAHIAPFLKGEQHTSSVVKFNVDSSSKLQFEDEKKPETTVCGMLLNLRLGNLAIYFIVTAKGIAKKIDEDYFISNATFNLEEIIDFTTPDIDRNYIIESFNAIAASYMSEGCNFISFFNTGSKTANSEN